MPTPPDTPTHAALPKKSAFKSATTVFADPRFEILRALREDTHNLCPAGQRLPRHTVASIAWHVMDALERTAEPEDLWSSSPEAADLTGDSTLGSHLDATKRALQF